MSQSQSSWNSFDSSNKLFVFYNKLIVISSCLSLWLIFTRCLCWWEVADTRWNNRGKHKLAETPPCYSHQVSGGATSSYKY